MARGLLCGHSQYMERHQFYILYLPSLHRAKEATERYLSYVRAISTK
jgi:hypothetical protein